MEKLGTIEEEIEECRKAFENSRVGDSVWCCHHDILCERLCETPETRIQFILGYKEMGERARRLREFRPIQNIESYNEYKSQIDPLSNFYQSKILEMYDEYLNKIQPLGNFHQTKIQEMYDEYLNKIQPLRDSYCDKIQPLNELIESLHRLECPNSTWDGKSIF